MITTTSAMLKALSGSKPQFTGIILYAGPSAIDGAPIVAIANRIVTKSKNDKTGAMVQTFIIRSDVNPIEALKTGDDSSVCGDCMHRPVNNGSCYVNVSKSVLSVYNAFKRGRYAMPGVDYDPAILPMLFAGRLVRLGTYGDPAAIPFQIWRATTLNAAGINGYSHQWRNPKFQAFKLLCMASADSVADMQDAHAMGWRTFRVRRADESVTPKLEAICPASAEAGKKTTCADCRACGGTSAKARVSMVIISHGVKAKRFINA